MISFPVLKRLKVDEYSLYPGSPGQSGIDIVFDKGPTLIAGVNGLGKSTLIAILLRSLTGPFDLPKPAQDGDLGEVEPEPVPIAPRLLFAPRVSDKAEHATATVEVGFGSQSLSIRRGLTDLTILDWRLDGQDQATDESHFQDTIRRLMCVDSFFDVLLILRYVVFFLEDRRALVWGRTAQRELLRALFVSSASAGALSRVRYEMLSADSGYRNLRNVLNRRMKENLQEIARLTTVTGVRAELTILESQLEAVRTEEAKLDLEVAEVEALRQDARLRSANAALERDGAVRDLERIKVHAISQKFQDLDDSAIYILARLASEDFCLACETRRAGLGGEVTARLAANMCVVCGSLRHDESEAGPVDFTAERINELQSRIQACDAEIETSSREIKRSDETRREHIESLSTAGRRKLTLLDNLRRLRAQLPSTERSVDDLD